MSSPRRGPPSLTRALRLTLVPVILGSLLGAGGLLIALSAGIQGRALEERNRALAASVAHEVGVLLGGYRNALELLAALRRQSGQALAAAAKAFPAFDEVLYANEAGRVVAASREGGLLGFDVSRRDFFVEPRRRGAFYLSEAGISAESYAPIAALALPMCAEAERGGAGGVLVGILNLEALGRHVGELAAEPDEIVAEPDEIVAVADATGHFVVHSDPGRVRRRENLGAVGAEAAAAGRATIGGRSYFASLAAVPESDWTVLVAQPLELVGEAVARGAFVVLAAAASAAVLALAVLSAALRRAERGLAHLLEGTRAISAGDYGKELGEPPFADFAALAADFRAIAAAVRDREAGLQEAESKARADLAEKEVLIREIHHRVKNNLQLVVSLLSLQSGGPDGGDPAAAFADSINRVRAMAVIHELLYQSPSLARIDFAEYLRTLVETLLYSVAGGESRPELRLDLERIELDIDRALPCGLVANEAVTNSLKYACAGPDAFLAIRLSASEGRMRLELADGGPGIPEGKEEGDGGSLGISLIRNLAEQLHARLELRARPGTSWTLEFPLAPPPAPGRPESAGRGG